MSFVNEFKNRIYPIKIKKGIIYANLKAPQKHTSNILNSNVLLDFMNIKNDKQIHSFIDLYGSIENIDSPYRNRICEKPLKIDGCVYEAVSKTSEYHNMIYEVCSFIDWMQICRKEAKNKEKSDLCEDVKGLLNGSLDIINEHTYNIPVLLRFDENYNIYRQYNFGSLKQVIYFQISNKLLNSISFGCCRCGKMFESKLKTQLFCGPVCSKKYTKANNRESKKDNIKEQTYLSVYNHMNYYCFRENDGPLIRGFNFEDWKEQALRIKKMSTNFFEDMNVLCLESCSCIKCKNGIALFYKNKHIQKTSNHS